MKSLLVCLTKYPEKGKVKTRLAKDIGELKALEIQKDFIRKIWKTHKDSSLYDTLFYVAGGNQVDFGNAFHIPEEKIFLSIHDTHGFVMLDIFLQCLQEYDSVILIGSDIPIYTEEQILKAFNILKEKDIVLGPTNDGGYGLIGMKLPCKEIFNITFSTTEVMNNTLEILQKKSLSYILLEEEIDIDTFDDLQAASKQYLFYKNLCKKYEL